MFSLNNFGLWAEKTWTFSKTLRHDSQNRSLRVQMNIFKRFCGSKNNCMNVSGHRTETPDFRRKCFLEVVEGDFKCPVQHFDKKLIRVKFTFCGLFRTLCVFFCCERKVSQGFQNHKLSVQRKNLGRVFLKRKLFQNIFSFWAEKLGVSAKNYWHGCQNCKLRTFRKFWGKTVFLNWIANLFGLWDEKNRALVEKKISSGFLQQEFALPEKCFEEKWFLFRESFFYRFWSLSNFFVFLQNCSVRCAKPPINVQSDIKVKINLEKLFSLNNFGLWAEKTWTFSKTVWHDSQIRSLPVQMTVFRNLSGSKNNCKKFFSHWTETSDFRRKCFPRVVKGTVHVSNAILW